MDKNNRPHEGFRHDVSPYLQRPLRTFAEACRDIAEHRQKLRRARLANDNHAIHPVIAGAALRRGGPVA